MKKFIRNNIAFIVLIGAALIFLLVFLLSDFSDSYKDEGVKLRVLCGEDAFEDTYIKGDVFSCEVLGDNFEFTINKITKSKVVLNVNNYGLIEENEDGTINLLDKQKEFKLTKDKKLNLAYQATDVSAGLTISWE